MKSRPRGISQLEAGVDDFSAGVAEARERTPGELGPGTDLAQDRDTLRAALEELRVAHEELAVADEELHAQLEELSRVTTRAQLERDRYRELFDLAVDGHFVTDRAGVTRDVNAAGATLLGVEPRFLYGKPLVAYVDAADTRVFRSAVETVRNGASVEIEVRLKRRNGDPLWHALTAHSIESGSALLWLAHNVDARHAEITSQAEAEAAGTPRSKRVDRLERANRDKTELLERERTLRKQLEDEDEAKDRFIAVLAHDLRAPLNAVIGWTELLRREVLDKHARDRALATIERNARAQLRLVEELLDISRVGEDQAQLERAPIDLDELVQRRADALAPAAHASGVQLRFSPCTERVVVAGDQRRLEQVVTKLIANALAATPSGGRVGVTVTRDGTTARITVEDNGRGIAPRALLRLFDPFRQDEGQPNGGEALGLGLYIARRAIDLHGGRLVAESEGVGRGAVLTVTLPLLASSARRGSPEPATAPATLAPPASPPPDADTARPVSAPPSRVVLHGIRVLVVDDEEDTRELLTTILRHRGATVTAAGDVEAALVAFEASPPDVLVSDIGMPGRNGFDLARTLRAKPTTRATLIAVSGFASSDEVEAALDAGFHVHLAKPIDPDELVGAIREAAESKPR